MTNRGNAHPTASQACPTWKREQGLKERIIQQTFSGSSFSPLSFVSVGRRISCLDWRLVACKLLFFDSLPCPSLGARLDFELKLSARLGEALNE